MPYARGYGYLQGGVPVSFLQVQVEASGCIFDGADLLVVQACVQGAQCSQLFHADTPDEHPYQAGGGNFHEAQISQICKPDLPGMVHQARDKEPRQAKVILWADTFNNYFHPEVAIAGVEALEANGYQVYVPSEELCCGRPLFDFGMLGLAKYLLRQVLRTLRPLIEEGVPVVGLEPACLTTFRDELISLFPDDLNALRLSRQSFFLGEFLSKKAAWVSTPELRRKALVHGHCSHKSIFTLNGEEQVMKKMGLDYTILDSGCCASREHLDSRAQITIFQQLGERVLLPAIRGADKSTIIIADGFSCREQIAQMTDRRALHLAQVLCMALHKDEGQTTDYPERKFYKS